MRSASIIEVQAFTHSPSGTHIIQTSSLLFFLVFSNSLTTLPPFASHPRHSCPHGMAMTTKVVCALEKVCTEEREGAY